MVHLYEYKLPFSSNKAPPILNGTMIRKPTIIVTSLGRTGTKFFAEFFKHVIPNVTSLHEPDVFTTSDIRYEGLGHIIKQFREAGILNMLARKLYRKWNLIELSDARVRGGLSYEVAVAKTIAQRQKFISMQPGNVYVESSIVYYGLIDVLEDVFIDVRSIYFVRDGRSWVRSWMDWVEQGGMYNKGKLRSLVAHTWPTALEFDDDPYHAKWSNMSRFERLCWGWAKLNEYAVRSVAKSESARLFRFEDIFLAKNRGDYLADMFSFLGDLPGVAPVAPSALEKWIGQPVHKSKPGFPSWENWTTEQKQQFRTICGPLMDELAYDL